MIDVVIFWVDHSTSLLLSPPPQIDESARPLIIKICWRDEIDTLERGSVIIHDRRRGLSNPPQKFS